MRSFVTLVAFVCMVEMALGAICNNKGLCMWLTHSEDDHFTMSCTFKNRHVLENRTNGFSTCYFNAT